MYRLCLMTLLSCLLTAWTAQAQSLTGTLIDENDQPLPYANVVLLSLPDSAFVTGTVSSEDGTFVLRASGSDGLIRISSIGYATLYKRYAGGSLGTLRLLPDAQTLDEVVVKADLPKVQLKGDAQVTHVQGTILEQAGTGNDLLNKLPGVSADEGTVNVFGSGTAEVYINGRKVRDASELDQLASDNIRRVEVVRNPGARYGAQVKAVVRILTRRAQGEGLGISNRLSTYHRYGWSVLDQLNFNYRRGGFDLGGMLYGSLSHNEDNKGIVQETFLDRTWRQESDLRSTNCRQDFAATLSLNQRFGESHSAGLRYDWDRTPRNRWEIQPLPTTVSLDGSPYEESLSSGWERRPSTTHTLNAYYHGQPGEWSIDFNADGLWGRSYTPQEMLEQVTAADGTAYQQTITNRTQTKNTLYAAKLVAGHPLWGGSLSIGSEYTYSDRTNRYTNAEGILDNSDSRICEHAVSLFAEYARTFGTLQATAGLRYEHLASDYFEAGQHVPGQSRIYRNVFPSLILSLPVGRTQWQLAYAGKTDRPSYYQLRSNVTYVNRYTYESGNPSLKPAIEHRLSLNASYRWVYLSLSYLHRRDGALYRSEPYSEDNPAISLMQYVNARAADRLNAALTFAPEIGLWSPQFTVMFQQQWFPADTPQGPSDFHHPLAYFWWENSFRLPAGFRIDIDLNACTRGDSENSRLLRGTCSLDAALHKSFLSDRLTLQLSGTDLFNSSRAPLTLYSGNHLMTIDQQSRRRVTLTLRFKFNAAKSNYKGTGAGEGQKSRM